MPRHVKVSASSGFMCAEEIITKIISSGVSYLQDVVYVTSVLIIIPKSSMNTCERAKNCEKGSKKFTYVYATGWVTENHVSLSQNLFVIMANYANLIFSSVIYRLGFILCGRFFNFFYFRKLGCENLFNFWVWKENFSLFKWTIFYKFFKIVKWKNWIFKEIVGSNPINNKN